MDMVRIRASISAGGLRKGQEVTVAETPMIAGGIKSGVYVLLERIQSSGITDPSNAEWVPLPGSEPIDLSSVVPVTEPDDPTHPAPDDEPDPAIEDVELPPSADVHDLEPPRG